MRLSAEKVKAAILHVDQDVREAAFSYFARSFSPDPGLMPLVIQAIERYGFKDAFLAYSFLDDLVQTEDTVRWLIQQIEQAGRRRSKQAAQPFLVFSPALIHADPVLLQRHEKTIRKLKTLNADARDAIQERIEFLSRPPEELWRDLDEFCQVHETDESVPDEDFAHAYRLVEALGRYPDRFAERVLAILSGDTGDFDNWWEGFAVRLAGEMKLQTAIPFLVETLSDPGDWLCEECHRALSKIGREDIVSLLAQECPTATWNLRLSAACILEEIHSDGSVQTCLDLLKGEEDHQIKCLLLQSILFNFATEGIEPARQFILHTPLDPAVLEVRSALLTTCKLMGERFPEFDAWRRDAINDKTFRRRWYQTHPLLLEKDFEESLEEEKPAPPPVPPVPRKPRISREEWETSTGRNDPCPCGSGKKFKRCCMNKGQNKDDSGPPAVLSGVSSRIAPPKYPLGTVDFYGPDDKETTKLVARVVKREGAEPISERWVGSNARNNPKVKRQVQQFFEKHGVHSVVTSEGNKGCPHEEGVDFPTGEDCPSCPFWKGKQGSARTV